MSFDSPTALGEWLKKCERAVAAALYALPEHRRQQAFVRVVAALQVAAGRDPKLLECSRQSLLRGLLLCATVDLYPGGHQPDVYVQGRRNKGVQELDVTVSFRGLKKLVERSGNTGVQSVAVYADEQYSVVQTMSGLVLEHHIALDVDRTWDSLVGCYAIGTLPSGERVFEAMSRQEIEARRAQSPAFQRGYGPWVDWPVEMARKTVLRHAIARGTFALLDAFELALSDGDVPSESRHDVIDAATLESLAPEPEQRPATLRSAIAEQAPDLDAQEWEASQQREAEQPEAESEKPAPKKRAKSAPDPEPESEQYMWGDLP